MSKSLKEVQENHRARAKERGIDRNLQAIQGALADWCFSFIPEEGEGDHRPSPGARFAQELAFSLSFPARLGFDQKVMPGGSL